MDRRHTNQLEESRVIPKGKRREEASASLYLVGYDAAEGDLDDGDDDGDDDGGGEQTQSSVRSAESPSVSSPADDVTMSR